MDFFVGAVFCGVSGFHFRVSCHKCVMISESESEMLCHGDDYIDQTVTKSGKKGQ